MADCKEIEYLCGLPENRPEQRFIVPDDRWGYPFNAYCIEPLKVASVKEIDSIPDSVEFETITIQLPFEKPFVCIDVPGQGTWGFIRNGELG